MRRFDGIKCVYATHGTHSRGNLTIKFEKKVNGRIEMRFFAFDSESLIENLCLFFFVDNLSCICAAKKCIFLMHNFEAMNKKIYNKLNNTKLLFREVFGVADHEYGTRKALPCNR